MTITIHRHHSTQLAVPPSQTQLLPPQSTGAPPGKNCGSTQYRLTIVNQAESSLQFKTNWTGTIESGTLGTGKILYFAQGEAGVRVQRGYGLGAGNTLIEGSWKPNGVPDIDVSMVDDFSMPIVCADSTGTVVTGCNIDLGGETDCNSKGGTWSTNLQNCLNPAGAPSNPLNNGPQVAFSLFARAKPLPIRKIRRPTCTISMSCLSCAVLGRRVQPMGATYLQRRSNEAMTTS